MSEPLLNVMKIMLLAGLYLFFVRVLWSVYNELRDPRTRPPRPATGAAPSSAPRPRATMHAGLDLSPTATIVGQLEVIEPPHLAGVAYALGNEITLGRASTCGIHLDDGYVSTVHARIFATDEGFFIEDLDSRNGSLLNGDPLSATTALHRGDVLQLGATVLEFS